MNIAQFIILSILFLAASILFLAGIFCQVYNILIELEKNDVSITSFPLLISVILCLTIVIVYGLGVIVNFTGVYKI